MGNKTVASGTSVQSLDGCNTWYVQCSLLIIITFLYSTCSDGVLGCTEMACCKLQQVLPFKYCYTVIIAVCTAGGMTIVDGGQVDDGCSVW